MAKSATSRQLEVERKFDVAADVATPSFAGLAVVGDAQRLPAQSLDAVYYDTTGADLAANKITLRRRTGGTDAGWHLKLPGAAGLPAEVRTEIHAPLSHEIPGELLDMVLAIVRDRPLAPVARITNERDVTLLRGRDGTPLAEFCDDHVTATRVGADGAEHGEQRWREWEVELIDPAAEESVALMDQLVDRLADAGARPAGHGSKLAKVIGDRSAAPESAPADPVHRAVAEQIARLREWDRAVRVDAEDAVHQMRVATRQIRSLLQSSEEAFGLGDDSWVLSELRELAALLGTARDAEVLAERYRVALDALPGDLVRGPVRERLVDGARRQYRAGLRRSLTAMRSARYFRLLDALDALVTAAPAESRAGGGHAATIESSYRKVRKAAKAAKRAPDAAQHDHAVHRIRKAAKRLRYVAAATGHTWVERRSKEIQTLLGDHQDSVVSREHLLAQAAAAHAAGEDTFTYGVLYRQEADLAARCEQQLGAALKGLRRSLP